jgi:hypothetical protein
MYFQQNFYKKKIHLPDWSEGTLYWNLLTLQFKLIEMLNLPLCIIAENWFSFYIFFVADVQWQTSLKSVTSYFILKISYCKYQIQFKNVIYVKFMID